MLPDWALMRPETLRESLIDHHHLGRGAVVVVLKKPALNERNLHSAEIICAGKALVHLQFLPGGRVVAFHLDVSPANGSSQGQHINFALRRHSGEMGNAVLDFAVKTDHSFIFFVVWTGDGYFHG